MEQTLCIKDSLLLDENLKAYDVFIFMQLVRLCNKEDSILTISAVDLMKETRSTNKGILLNSLKKLAELNYIDRLDNIDKKATYKINKEYYFK